MRKSTNQSGNIFLLIVFTSFAIFLFSTKIGELAAIGILIIIPCIFGIAKVLKTSKDQHPK